MARLSLPPSTDGSESRRGERAVPRRTWTRVRFVDETEPTGGRSSHRGPCRVGARAFTRTHQSGAAIDDCRFVWCVPGAAFAGRLGLGAPEQAHGRYERPLLRSAERRSGSTPGRGRSGCSLPSASETPGGSTCLRLASAPVLLARWSALAGGVYGRCSCGDATASRPLLVLVQPGHRRPHAGSRVPTIERSGLLELWAAEPAQRLDCPSWPSRSGWRRAQGVIATASG